MEILSFYVKVQTLKYYFDKALGWLVFWYVTFLFSFSVLSCFLTIYQLIGMRLSWLAGSFIYATSQAFILKLQQIK